MNVELHGLGHTVSAVVSASESDAPEPLDQNRIHTAAGIKCVCQYGDCRATHARDYSWMRTPFAAH
jgi:hypothetical protein